MLPPQPPFARSWAFALGLGVALIAAVVALYPSAPVERSDRFLCDAARSWRATHEGESDLQVAITEIAFSETPGMFARGEAMVVAPVAVSLPGEQEVLDLRGDPPPSRALQTEGIHLLTWEYAGRVHREMRFVGIAFASRSGRCAASRSR